MDLAVEPDATAIDITKPVGGVGLATDKQLRSLTDALAQAEVQQGAVDTSLTQLSQQQQANNAQAAMNIGRRTALQVGLIGAAVGLYNIISGNEAGQVWERLEGGGDPVRRPELEAASRTQVTAAQETADLAIRPLAARFGPQTAPNLQAALTAGAGQLENGDFFVTAPLTISAGLPMRGRGQTTVIRPPSWGSIKSGAVLRSDPGTVGVARGEQIAHLAIDNSDVVPGLTGLEVAGSQRSYRDIVIRGFAVGVKYSKQDTFNTALYEVTAENCRVGVQFGPDNTNSGSEMAHYGLRVLGEVEYPIEVLGPEYFPVFYSGNYENFNRALIRADYPIFPRFVGGWIETSCKNEDGHAPHLVRHNGPTPLDDLGVVTFSQTWFVWLLPPAPAWGDLVYAISRGMIVFDNCMVFWLDANGSRRQTRLHGVYTHHKAFGRDVGPVTDRGLIGPIYTNNTLADLVVRLNAKLMTAYRGEALSAFAGMDPNAMPEVARIQVARAGVNADAADAADYTSASELMFTVPAGMNYQLAATASATVTRLDYEFKL